MNIAFKEWAVICRALAEGRQALILRKGGIAENDDTFQVEHLRFWLYPTYTHQQHTGIKPEARPLLDDIERNRPPADIVRLSHFAEIVGVYRLLDLNRALLMDHLHLWSEETVRMRFTYRTPGLYVLPMRIYRVAQTFEIKESQRYAGCRSWVELETDLSPDDSQPVFEEKTFKEYLKSLDNLLRPVALA